MPVLPCAPIFFTYLSLELFFAATRITFTLIVKIPGMILIQDGKGINLSNNHFTTSTGQWA
jgi:hypothetical protein